MPISGSKVRLDHTKPKDKKQARLISKGDRPASPGSDGVKRVAGTWLH